MLRLFFLCACSRLQGMFNRTIRLLEAGINSSLCNVLLLPHYFLCGGLLFTITFSSECFCYSYVFDGNPRELKEARTG